MTYIATSAEALAEALNIDDANEDAICAQLLRDQRARYMADPDAETPDLDARQDEHDTRVATQYARIIEPHPAYDREATDALGETYIADGRKYATRDGRMVRYVEQDRKWIATSRPVPTPDQLEARRVAWEDAVRKIRTPYRSTVSPARLTLRGAIEQVMRRRFEIAPLEELTREERAFIDGIHSFDPKAADLEPAKTLEYVRTFINDALVLLRENAVQCESADDGC